MKVYTARSVAKLLDLSVAQVRAYARAASLHPARGPRGEYRFSFQDLVLLRTAKGLVAARIPARKVRRVLNRLRQQLPRGRSLSGVQITASGDRVVVRDGDAVWNPESGQACFNFDVAELAHKVAPHAQRAARETLESDENLSAHDWHELGSELEAAAPAHAREAYRRALELNPQHVDTHVNLGRLLHEERKLHAAEAHYRLALSARPRDATALFNLGVCLEDQGKTAQATAAYLQTIEADPRCADAHFNVARLFEKAGDATAALRHLKIYRRLSAERS